MVVRLYTFLYVPDIIELVDIALPEEFLNLRVPVSQNAVQSHTTSVQKVETSLQTFLLHVVTSSHFITLSKKHVKKACCYKRSIFQHVATKVSAHLPGRVVRQQWCSSPGPSLCNCHTWQSALQKQMLHNSLLHTVPRLVDVRKVYHSLPSLSNVLFWGIFNNRLNFSHNVPGESALMSPPTMTFSR